HWHSGWTARSDMLRHDRGVSRRHYNTDYLPIAESPPGCAIQVLFVRATQLIRSAPGNRGKVAMTFFRIVWGIAIVVALVGVAFFLIGIADGSVSSFNIVLWIAVLAG